MGKNRIGLSLEFFERLLTYTHEYIRTQQFGVALSSSDEEVHKCMEQWKKASDDEDKLREIIKMAK